MSRIKQNPNGHGSLKDIQILISKHPELLNALICGHQPSLQGDKITWLSPHEKDDFAEYRDDDFINLLGLKLCQSLTKFWTKRGHQTSTAKQHTTNTIQSG